MTIDPLQATATADLPADEAIAPENTARPRASVRKAFLQLLLLALVPLVILGVGRSALQLGDNQALVETRLSERAVETARSEAEVIRTAQAVLRLLADNDDVRAGGMLCDLRLSRVGLGFVAFSNFTRVGADGRRLCASSQAASATVAPAPAWWSTAARKPGFFVVTPRSGTVSPDRALVAVQPIKTEAGRFHGVITAQIDLDWMQRSLRTRGLGDDAVALVLDQEGRTLLSSREVDLGSLDVQIGAGRIADRSDESGRRWTYAVAPLLGASDGNRKLYVAYAMPEAQLFSAAWWQAGISLVQPLVAVLLASLAIWYGTNRLVLRWLRELRTMALAFTAGDYRASAADFNGAPTEFRDVAAAFYKTGQAVDRRDHDLRAALERQNQLVREIHHRVKNNLQIVMSLISLQADRLGTESGRAALSQTRLRISALALVHRLLYETGEQTTISAAELLGGVCELVVQGFRDRLNVTLSASFDEEQLALDTAIPLALWLVDALSNAWLHGFPGDRVGRIGVSLVRDGRFGVLEVVDDGVGFAADALPAPSSRGLRILNGIGRQVGGRTDVISTEDEGTTVRLRYPTGVTTRSVAP